MVHAHHDAGDAHLLGLGVAHLARQRLEAASRGELKVSNDPHFAHKRGSHRGNYLNSPEHALGALDRTQPGLPMKKGRCATVTHDYKRDGTITLFR